MSKMDMWQRYERPQMVDPGEIESVWIARDAVAVVMDSPRIEGRKPQAWIKLKGGQNFTVIGTARDVAMTISGHFDE